MNYQQTIDFLYNQLPMFSRIGASAISPGLDNTYILCERLNNPEKKFKSIHIAGTNGKGSTSHMIAAILQESGYSTGLYTSPHLWDFRERIRVNGKMIEKDAVEEFVEFIMPSVNEIKPSFFELTVAMAFWYFSEKKTDFAVIETGMGGRLDSTNVIQPVLSVITNIGLDHTDKLGNTLEAIAKEKAGIIKLNTPVIIGNTQEETTEVFRSFAKDKNAPVLFADQIWRNTKYEADNYFLKAEFFNSIQNKTITLATDQKALYQIKNLPAVLETVEQLREKGFLIPEEKMLNALRQVNKLTGLRGRWETLKLDPKIIADVGHNTDGITAILKQPEISEAENLHIVIGMVKDKDISPVLSLLPSNANYYITQAHIPRALPSADLLKMILEKGLKASKFENVNEAISAAKQNSTKQDLILICGSFFLIAEIELQNL